MIISHQRPSPRFSLRTTQRSRGEHGYVMALFGLLLVPLLLMVGLAVDVGYWYSRASDMRRAADAAALAGVVWLPDEAAAKTAALAAAAKNGFVPSSTVSISVKPSQQSERRLVVSIKDSKVGSFFYGSLGGRTIDLTRTSYAEYVLAVPMGSPRNFFGTGTLLANYTATGITPEYLYQSVNPYCTDKVNGDRYQSGYFNSAVSGTCTNTVNSEYRTSGYSMYIEAPVGRSSNIDVRLYDARYNDDDISWQVQGADDCQTSVAYTNPSTTTWTQAGSSSSTVTLTGPLIYTTRSSTGSSWGTTETTLLGGRTATVTGNLTRWRSANVTWTPSSSTWTTGSGSGNITLNGWTEYQTRSSSGSNTWSSTNTIAEGASSVTRTANLTRYRTATIATQTICTPTYTTVTDSGIDDHRQTGDDNYTYTLYQADNTPLNDDDNPQICQATFTKDSAFDSYEYLGSRRWNTLCTISTSQPSGRYILRVTNSGAISSPKNDGSNQWGLVAKYTSTGDGLCDGRTDTMCPRVYGKDAISVRAAATTSVASFYMAEIAPEHAGKKLKIELWDPGEGGSTIQMMKPSGTNGNTWTAATFSWKANTSPATSGTNVTSLDVTQSKFDGKLVEITIDLSGYAPPVNNRWWQIKYTFSGTVTDRTTWSARIIGDPVHLVEEY